MKKVKEPSSADALIEKPPRNKGDWQNYKRLLGYVAPYWYLLVGSIVGFLAAAAAEAYFVELFGELIDRWDAAVVVAAMSIPMLMFGAALVRALGTIVGETLISRVSFNVVFNLRQDLFAQLLKLPSYFYDKSTQGHIVSRLTFTVAQLRDTGTDAIRAIIQDGLKVLVYMGFMLWLNWQLTLLFIATAPILALVVIYASNRFRRISRRIQNSMGDVTHVVSETVSGYRVVRTFGGEEYEQKRFDRFSRINRQQSLKMAVTKVSSAQLNETLVSLAICVVILLLYGIEGMSAGEAVKFLGLAGLLGRPIRKLSEVNAKLQRGLAAAEDVFAQLDQSTEIDSGDQVVERVRGELSFENVSFGYGEGIPVLRNVDLKVKPGQTVAIVGRSGSGKSTLASLLPRFYEVSSGRILLDDVDVRDYQLESLREQIALVSQQVTLFNDSLRNNVAYGNLSGKPDDAIQMALTQAHATEFVDALAEGIDTVVGDDGVMLSGGQRQRIAIARAFLKDAPVLVLDEATSALDNESERHIQEALEAVMKGRTTLVIAHRLSTVEAADLIIVLDDGRIVERGTHQELISAQGPYAELYSSQFNDEPTSRPKPSRRSKSQAAKLTNTDTVDKTSVSLSQAWYDDSWWLVFLRPLSWLYGFVAKRRHRRVKSGKRVAQRTSLPVVVVGNITVGGTGKTPLVGWLVDVLMQRGFTPGVVLRGYKGKLSKTGTLVPSGADPERYSDEAVQLRDRLGCAVAIAADRIKGLRLLETQGCDIAISDDGLQHYNMARDIEIAVVDGNRGVGNGRLIPAGPLREPTARLNDVDWVVANGEPSGLVEDETIMRVQVDSVHNVVTGEVLPPDQFVQNFPTVHAVCGIGNPSRFFRTVADLGLISINHAYPDHFDYGGTEFGFDDALPVVCTEKDAAKLKHLELELHHVWYLRISVCIPDDAQERFLMLLDERAIVPRSTEGGGEGEDLSFPDELSRAPLRSDAKVEKVSDRNSDVNEAVR